MDAEVRPIGKRARSWPASLSGTRSATRSKWARLDSNQGPTDYESAALTS